MMSPRQSGEDGITNLKSCSNHRQEMSGKGTKALVPG